MIERMETMVRFQREAFRRTEELTGNRSRRFESLSLLNSSDDSESDNNSTDRIRELFMRNVPRSFRVTREDFVNLRRDVTQFRARRLLGYMVKSLTEFFEENSTHVLDEQIISKYSLKRKTLTIVQRFNNSVLILSKLSDLYTLLHLALELTDLLLEQLNATRSV